MAVFNFLDTYKNLTIKTLCSLHFVNIAYDTKYVYKIDDDTFPKLKTILTLIPSFKTNSTNVMFGHVMKNVTVLRKGRWGLSYEELPNKIFLDYVEGPLYILTMGAVKSLLNANVHVPLTFIEDASMGILANKSGQIEFVDIPKWTKMDPKKKTTLLWCAPHYSTHKVPARFIPKLWGNCSDF